MKKHTIEEPSLECMPTTSESLLPALTSIVVATIAASSVLFSDFDSQLHSDLEKLSNTLHEAKFATHRKALGTEFNYSVNGVKLDVKLQTVLLPQSSPNNEKSLKVKIWTYRDSKHTDLDYCLDGLRYGAINEQGRELNDVAKVFCEQTNNMIPIDFKYTPKDVDLSTRKTEGAGQRTPADGNTISNTQAQL